SSINFRGVKFGASLSRFMIISIILAMLVFIGYAYLGYEPQATSIPAASYSAPSQGIQGFAWMTAFFAAALSAFWGYEGWNNVGYIGEEVKNPQKNIPLALILGTTIIILLYMAMNA